MFNVCQIAISRWTQKVIVAGGGYAGENGLDYLREHGVDVQTVEGPKDPRLKIMTEDSSG